MSSEPVPLPAAFGAARDADVFFQAYDNAAKAVRSKVRLTHHLISLVQEGEKEVIVAGHCVKVDDGQLVMLAATSGIMSEHSLEGRPMRSMLLFLSPAFLLDHCARHGIRPRGKAAPLGALPHDAFTRHYTAAIELLGTAALNADPALRRTKADEILLYLWAARPQGFGAFLSAALQQRTDLPLRTVIAQHQDSNLSIPELAFLCHMSVSTFKRRFQETFGSAPGRYLQDRRMERAKAMLAQKRRPSDIYLDLGYGSLAAFSAEFKKHFGVAPTAVR